MAPATINCELAYIRRVLNVALADQFIDTNPVKGVKFFRENNARVRYLDDVEEAALRKVVGSTGRRSPWRCTRGSAGATSFGSDGRMT